jgi:hypothetical protein
MLRAVVEEALLFLIPFALFALYLALRKRNPFHRVHWDGQGFWLVLAGFLCAGAALLYTGLTAERHKGAFDPTHLENGRVVPGQFR